MVLFNKIEKNIFYYTNDACNRAGLPLADQDGEHIITPRGVQQR